MISDSVFRTTSLIYHERIGSGASSVVFKAFDKGSGEYRAAKVIKERSKYNLLDLNREITSLRNLSHPNIVKLYGKETEIGSGCDVLILGYCQTSLYSFLQEPENLHGLRDQEFLTLFSDICSGLEYLHSNGIIHRDLKPGNILRDTKPDLTPIYIISDFGTSRKLENPEDEYLSLVGTEEFLHPAVYQKAFIDKTQVTPFNSGTDLWSFGCTLFQAISSRMPFIPVDGARSNRTIMFEMVALKPSGCISAYQNSSGGDIIWEDRFPQHCPMSRNLQEIMKDLISSLLEADHRKQMSHASLFAFHKKLATRFQLEIHITNDGTTLPLYFDPSNSFAELQEAIAKYTDISAGRQVLFYNDQILENLIQKDLSLVQLFHQPPSINSLTLVVKNRAKKLIPFNIEPFPVYHNTNTINTDYQLTSKRCEIVNNIMILVSQSISFQLNITKTISAMWFMDKMLSLWIQWNKQRKKGSVDLLGHRNMMKTFILKIEKNYECLNEASEQIGYQQEHIRLMRNTSQKHGLRTLRGFYSKRSHRRKSGPEELTFLKTEMQHRLEAVKELVFKFKTKSEKYLYDSQIAFDVCTCNCVRKAEMYQEKIKAILWRMKKTKALGEIRGEKENIHHLHDRCESEEVCAASLALWQDHCWNHKQKSFERCQIFERIFYESQEQCKKANRMMVELRGLCNRIGATISKIYSSLPENSDRFYNPRTLTLISDAIDELDLDDDVSEFTDVGDEPRPKVNFKDSWFEFGERPNDDERRQYDHEKYKWPYFSVDDKKYVPSREKRGVGSIPAEEQDKRHVTNKSRLENEKTWSFGEDKSQSKGSIAVVDVLAPSP